MFIRDFSCISPQKTYDNSFFEELVITHDGTRYAATEPRYGAMIPAGQLRRMGKSVRMGVGSGLPLVFRNNDIDGIILATANGGLEDCLKFLNQIVEYNEGSLTPTNFVQSTPNAVAGNLALLSKNIGYNITHVHDGLAFEAAMLDALMHIEDGKLSTFLLGSVDEISDYNFNINLLSGVYKYEQTNSDTLLASGTPGTVCGEGAAMFVVEANHSENSVAEIVDVEQVSLIPESEIHERFLLFLSRNKIQPEEIDTIVLGFSGDTRNDHYYTNLREKFFSHSSVYSYKNLVGDYPTSSGFATWLAVQILAGKTIPEQFKYSVNSKNKKSDCILIYNHFQGKQHGFILLKKPSSL